MSRLVLVSLAVLASVAAAQEADLELVRFGKDVYLDGAPLDGAPVVDVGRRLVRDDGPVGPSPGAHKTPADLLAVAQPGQCLFHAEPFHEVIAQLLRIGHGQ